MEGREDIEGKGKITLPGYLGVDESDGGDRGFAAPSSFRIIRQKSDWR